MKISIVTVSYNQGHFIRETIESVLNQNYKDIEYIIIDGGSTDETLEIIKEYENELSYWVSEKDVGAADALNKGLSKCTGDYFYYLNSDDIILPNKLTEVVDFIHKHPNSDVYYGHGYTTDSNLDNRVKMYSDLWNIEFFRFRKLMIVQMSSFFRLNFIRNNEIEFNVSNTTSWDSEFFVDIFLKGGQFKRMNLFVALFRLHENSISVSGKRVEGRVRDKSHSDLKEIEKKIEPQLGKKKYSSSLVINIVKVIRDPFVMLQKLRLKLQSKTQLL